MKLPKILTRKEEIEILTSALEEANILGNGSSRIVLSYGDYVVKVAFDAQGQKQNETEYDTWCQYGYTGLFAEVFAYGNNLIVMEWVEVSYSIEDVEEAIHYYFDTDEGFIDSEDDDFDEEMYDVGESYWNIKTQIDEILGETDDNMQIGLTPNGLVAYDYGLLYGQFSASVSDSLRYGIADLGRIALIENLLHELIEIQEYVDEIRKVEFANA